MRIDDRFSSPLMSVHTTGIIHTPFATSAAYQHKAHRQFVKLKDNLQAPHSFLSYAVSRKGERDHPVP